MDSHNEPEEEEDESSQNGHKTTPSRTDEPDLYALLKLSRSATASDVQRAYKRLSRVFHPDKSQHHSSSHQLDAQKAFVSIKLAHDVLTDPVLRMCYDHAGLLAVVLVRRSQAQRASKASNGEDDDENDEDDDDNSDTHIDLFTQMKQAPTREESIRILDQALEEYKQLQAYNQQQGSSMHASMDLPTIYGNQLYQEGTLLRFQSSHQFAVAESHNMAWSVGASSTRQHTSQSDVNLSASVNYQLPTRGKTSLSVDTLINKQQLSLQTSRQLANGTFMMVGLSGNLQQQNSWNYSIASYRTILQRQQQQSHDDQKYTRKLQASWRVVVRPRGALQNILFHIKTLYFPQWAFRIAGGNTAFPLKVSYQQAKVDAPYISFSWGFFWSRIKVLWVTQVVANRTDTWTIKYGLKYDGRKGFMHRASLPRIGWSLLFYFQSSHWNIRIPIALHNPQQQHVFIASMATLILSQWLDESVEDFFGATKRIKGHVPGQRRPNTSTLLPWSDMIQKVATKKRAIEDASDGLVILRADCRNHDISHVLQYWVVNGNVRFPSSVHDWWTEVEQSNDVENEEWSFFFKARKTKNREKKDDTDGSLYVRYRYKRYVYEITFHNDELVRLPNARATQLGPSASVS